MNSPIFKWLIKFWALAAVLYWLDQSRWFNQHVLAPFSHLSALATYQILSLLGVGAQWNGATVTTGSSSFEIAGSCTGSLIILMYTAAVLSFPASWKARLQGFLIGFFAISFFNILRASLIVIVASRFPESFWSLHIVIGQIIVITGTLAIFLWWAKYSVSEGLPPFLQHHRGILKTLFLFALGFACGYGVYKVFLGSFLGRWTERCVVAHAAWLLSGFSEASSQGLVLGTASHSVRLVPGCLSSPVVVMAMAVVFAWPIRWWKKGVILILGFLPVYYTYHLMRTIFVFVSLPGGTKKDNFIYNFYGQVILAVGVLFFAAYWWVSERRLTTYKRFLPHVITVSVASLLIAVLLGSWTRAFLIPWMMHWIKGVPDLTFDPQQTLSRMVDFQAFLWLALLWSTPVLSIRKKYYGSALGLLGILLCFAGTVGLLETLDLAPQLGLLKISAIAFPFAVYFLLFSSIHEHSSASVPPEKPDVIPGGRMREEN